MIFISPINLWQRNLQWHGVTRCSICLEVGHLISGLNSTGRFAYSLYVRRKLCQNVHLFRKSVHHSRLFLKILAQTNIRTKCIQHNSMSRIIKTQHPAAAGMRTRAQSHQTRFSHFLILMNKPIVQVFFKKLAKHDCKKLVLLNCND
jgi:hypothetical protein